MYMRKTLLSVAAVATLATAALAADSPATTTAPSAKVTPEAKALIDQMTTAYGGLTSLQVAGTYSADLDVAGKQRTEQNAFTGSFHAPNQFRHELKDDITTGSTGQKVFAYAKEPNVYFTADAPKERPATADLPRDVRMILDDQNPSLLMAVAKDPEFALTDAAAEVSTAAPTALEGTSYDTLVVSYGSDKPVTRYLVDPKTHLIRRAQTDQEAALRKRGAPDVKKALFTVDYTTSTAGAPATDAQFAWAAPAGARESAPQQADPGGEGAVKDLIGKPAPAFTLKQLGGGDVKLQDLKGSVVVLDFWATWCGPCVEGLPHVDAIYKDNKDKGVKAFAVNMQEDAADVQKFVTEKGLSLPVLLETKGDVAEKYKVEGIPETVVIGRDGSVKQVFVGTGPDTETRLRKTVEDALKEK